MESSLTVRRNASAGHAAVGPSKSGLRSQARRSLGIGCLLMLIGTLAGCTSSLIRSQTPEPEASAEEQPKNRLVRDMARVWGLRPTTVEGIALVSQLANTGSDPPASPQREMLLGDMQRRSVENPNAIMASPSTSLVIVRAQLPPAVQKGDRLDVEIMTPARSETTSLRNGWLMQTRLQEMAVLGNQLRQGAVLAQAEGSVVINSLLESDNDARSETRGRVLGGGVAGVSRSLGLVLMTEHHSVRASAMIGSAVNTRFHTYDRGTKRGVATPKRDNFIDLSVHSSYRNNLLRYVRVIQAIAVRETPHELIDRIAVLETELLQPHTAVKAAVDLEAIGPEALPTLRKGLESNSPLVRFAAAEALAYMNEEDAVAQLTESARSESAFRWHALTALAAMTKSEARDGLAELLHESSDETRYGAFEALRDFNPRDPLVRGQALGEAFVLHRVPSDTTPLVHIRRTERPEVVIFGNAMPLKAPVVLFAGTRIMIKSDESHRLKVSFFTLGDDDRTEYCENDLGAMLRTIVKVGGSYTDVVAAINEAKQKDNLAARVKFDALPTPGREYELEKDQEADPDAVDPEIFEEELPAEELPAPDLAQVSWPSTR